MKTPYSDKICIADMQEGVGLLASPKGGTLAELLIGLLP